MRDWCVDYMEFGFEDATEATDGVDPTPEPKSDPESESESERRTRQILLPEIRVHDTVAAVSNYSCPCYGIVLAIESIGTESIAAVLYVLHHSDRTFYTWKVRYADIQELAKTELQLHASDVIVYSQKHIPQKLRARFQALVDSPNPRRVQ